MSLPWSECDDDPAAIVRPRLRATMTSASAPHTPFWGPSPNGSIRHGPIAQLRQLNPSAQYPHCGCWSASRSQTVAMPSALAWSIMTWASLLMDRLLERPFVLVPLIVVLLRSRLLGWVRLRHGRFP